MRSCDSLNSDSSDQTDRKIAPVSTSAPSPRESAELVVSPRMSEQEIGPLGKSLLALLAIPMSPYLLTCALFYFSRVDMVFEKGIPYIHEKLVNIGILTDLQEIPEGKKRDDANISREAVIATVMIFSTTLVAIPAYLIKELSGTSH